MQGFNHWPPGKSLQFLRIFLCVCFFPWLSCLNCKLSEDRAIPVVFSCVNSVAGLYSQWMLTGHFPMVKDHQHSLHWVCRARLGCRREDQREMGVHQIQKGSGECEKSGSCHESTPDTRSGPGIFHYSCTHACPGHRSSWHQCSRAYPCFLFHWWIIVHSDWKYKETRFTN